ncbi:protein hairy-like [Saccostrea cucullata]|uniref:protein hairy-like n=1 Tax=Saccostrea cuccullata TaxID=36930 RepID=UPI002ED53CC6
METCLEDQAAKRIKLEVNDRPLNFAINPDEFDLQCVKKPKIPRDPMSHRIIEKRRRDRMNNCLAELSRLIPANYLKQGQGRIEKTEIIEMASKHIRHLQNLNNFHGGHLENFQVDGAGRACCEDKFYMGFKECQDEVMRYYVEFEGRDIKDPVCINIGKHLEQASQKFLPKHVKDHARTIKSDEIVINDTNSNQSSSNLMLEPQAAPPRSAPPESPSNGNQDRFLRTLLLPKETSASSFSSSSHSYSGSNISEESYLYPMSTRNPEGHQAQGREETEGSYSVSSHSTEKLNHSTDSDRDSSHNGSSKESHAYKLKHNIMKRFSQDEKREHHHHQGTPPSDTSSSSSREDEKMRRKYLRHKPRPQSSETSSVHSSSSGSDCQSNNIPLPAFVLNPDGTHYLPICIHPSFLENIFLKKESGKNSIYHPISIPVNFDGPYIAMPQSPLSQPCGLSGSNIHKDRMLGIPEVVN